MYILGREVQDFEAEIASFTGAAHAVGVANGTDALMLCLKASGIGPGDEVITTPMSYLATASSIALCGATAVFVDVDDSLNIDPARIEDAITDRTRAVSVVHLAGLPARMDAIAGIAGRRGLTVIEDCAQAFGAVYQGRSVGTTGRFAAISFHPLKNLGTPGDGGMILARNAEDAAWLRQARNHGHRSRDECDFWSVNSRLDELHAAFLRTQLRFYPNELARRRGLAEIYRSRLAGVIDFPRIHDGGLPSYNWVMGLVPRRQELIEHLAQRGIETKVHYPMLIPSLKAAQANCRADLPCPNAGRLVDRIISLPAAEHVTPSDVLEVCREIERFYAETPT
jgi:dTDP-4-amino-4,6-dideoxygalactose transaminase